MSVNVQQNLNRGDSSESVKLTEFEVKALEDAQSSYNNAIFAALPQLLKQSYLEPQFIDANSSNKSSSLGNLQLISSINSNTAKNPTFNYRGTLSLLSPSKRIALQAYVEDAIDQLLILENISSTSVSERTLIKKLCDQVAQLLAHQKSLEIRYQKVSEETNVYRQLANKQKYKEKQATLGKLASELQQNNQTLSKALRNYPSATQNTSKLQLERNNLVSLFKKTLRELSLTPQSAEAGDYKPCKLDELWHLVQAEYTQRHAVAATLIRESESTRTIQELQHQVDEEKRLMFKETQERSHVIQQLRDTIQEINALTESEKLYVKKELKAHETQVKQENQLAEMNMKNSKDKSALALQQENGVHDAIQTFLTETFSDLEKKIQDWIQKYEEDIEKKSNDLETLKQKRTSDLDKFEEMLTKCEELEKFVEAHRAEEARIQKERQLEYQKETAAILIQAWWRKILKKRGGLKRKGNGKKKGSGKTKKSAKK